MLEGGKLKMRIGALEPALRLLALRWGMTPEDVIRRLIADAATHDPPKQELRRAGGKPTDH